jgi:hypothetical protein
VTVYRSSRVRKHNAALAVAAAIAALAAVVAG